MMLLLFAGAACLAVAPQSDHVLVRDLAPQFPVLSQALPDAVVSFAPAPGAVRTFSVSELGRLAARLGVGGAPADDICVERPVAPLDRSTLLGAMAAVLPDAHIELVDFSRVSAPQGELQFRLADLRPGPPEGVYWRGSVRYGGNRQFSLWAKVKVTVTAARVTAIGDLPAGQLITPGLVTVRTQPVFPSAHEFAASTEEVAGKLPRVLIRAGSDIRLADLMAPKDVMRGDALKVDVISGAAHLEFDAVAESSGSVGVQIQVRNPASNKTFLARVQGKGKATVETPAPKGNQ